MKTSNRTVISNLQYFSLLVGGTIAFAHFIYSHIVIAYAGRDGWLSVLFFGVLCQVMAFAFTKLGVLQGERSLVQHITYVWGKWIGLFLSTLYIVYFIFIASLTLHLFASFLGIIYPRTPTVIWLFFLTIAIVWAMYSGLEVMARSVEMILPFLLFLGILATILAMPDRDYSQLMPILNNGLLPVWRGSLILVTMVSEMVVFNMIAPDVQNQKNLVKQGFIMAFVLMIMMLGPITGPVMIFGEKIAQILAYPTFAELQYLDAKPLLERLDLFGVVLWTFGAYFRVSIFGICAMRAVSETTKTKRYNAYSIPISLVIVGLGLVMPIDRADDFGFLSATYPVISIIMGLLIPSLLLVSTWIKNAVAKRKQMGRKRAQPDPA
ncbi:GerAB/ArcD/ProY family transporter [Ferroacidibacillus organovorans]|uniref:Uncharacterized protein n=1 Tax=Ferroacidibacillus organovorans TaxID=1765683 RepID=A0A853KDY3_9BACL|nr:endospore germination permease [Ferroacidibacillus organovorans]KYP79318.1 hypothetical protein AYJ22_04680 [Ferroacidibacillus organovorans]OAG95236.1 hypothetical protein AYW79_00750 [Ferroacidibacillus organovorans]